ncbi:hypothetical protein KC343_g6152 [Hortaea werneckii]|nr:hypothetical protein KC323_g4187 [Hortaea werneckii]KAI7278263.1 hypothetical protein KC352_g7511 [Hortaea werneckii]KAI7353823.1 hypothetical protein KC320_g3748 [Hortaea werneckii]KAI7558355.1 hypothetical protein KC317_g11059 [Hortaea werneckii]KAI7604408.1 hypothetical protein KC346_g11479 [Hortaea werneckii]
MAESPPDRAADALSAVEQPFRFFDLPRELRNAIYPQFRSSSRATRAFCRCSVRSAQFCLTGPYLPNLRYLSKQFKKEYDEEISAYLTLHMMTGSRIPDSNHLCIVEGTLPRDLFLSLRHLTLNLRPSSVNTWQRLDGDLNIATPLQKFPALESVILIVKSSIDSLEKAIEEADYDPVVFLTNPLPVPSQSSNHNQREAKVSKTLRLKNICYYPTWWERPATAKYQYVFSEDGKKEADMDFWPQNHIVYEATASEDENSWHGLDLATFSAG